MNAMLPKLLPVITGKVYSFIDKENKKKRWWGWEIEVGGRDNQNQPVTFIHLESAMMKPVRLFHTEEGAKKDLNTHVKKVEAKVKAAFEKPGGKVIGLRSRLRAFE